MQIRHLNEEDSQEWDAFVMQQPDFGLLQSSAWGAFKQQLGWRASRIAVCRDERIVAGAQVLFRPVIPGLASVAYIPRGPVGAWTDPSAAAALFAEIHRAARAHNAFFLKMEPPVKNNHASARLLHLAGFTPSRCTNQPRATLILDIRPDHDALLRQMRQKTRQYIRAAVRNGVTIRTGSWADLPAVIALLHQTAHRRHFSPRSRVYHEQEWRMLSKHNQGVFLMAFHQNRLLAVRMACCFGKHAAEFHAASTEESAGLHPNYLLVWHAIQWAKAKGCETYDLWGIPDGVGESVYADNPLPATDRADGLWGVYRFKSGFSNNVIFYLGAYDYAYSPRLYALMTRAFNSNTLERLAAHLQSSRPHGRTSMQQLGK